ncbi:MAG: hypothetical protein SLAVMIC_00972 [uncultured marine phage]|uniref:Uncharacterized protein n=1 Tax=uncultured marine phage TaxID=707152 RepID=A0A8D9C9V1_9VIRU|nr:MAG: hypothetical protein SLAVMIC_00972 [uncultured marine phage]
MTIETIKNRGKVVKEAESNRESYNVYHSLKRMWNYPDWIIATAVYAVGDDLNECDEYLTIYDSDYDGKEKGLEDALYDYYIGTYNGANHIQDASGTPTLDHKYLCDKIENYFKNVNRIN